MTSTNRKNDQTKSGASASRADLDPLVLADMAGLSQPKLFNDSSEQIKNQIIYEQSCGLFSVTLYAAFHTIFIASLCGLALWSVVPSLALISWYGVITMISVVRHILCRQFFKRQPSSAQLPRWTTALWNLTILSGTAWCGLVALVWSVSTTSVLVFVASIMATTVFFAYGALGIYKRFYFAFATPPAIGLALLLFHVIPQYDAIIAMVALAFFMWGSGFTSMNATRIWRNTFVLVHGHHNLSNEYQEKSTVLEMVLRSVGDAVLTLDRDGQVTYLNHEAERLTGFTIGDLAGKAFHTEIAFTDESAGGAQLDLDTLFKTARQVSRIPGELVLSSAHVNKVSVEVTVSPLLYSNNLINGYVITIRDVSSARLLARDLSHQARHDALTGLLNRRGFEARLRDSILRTTAGGTFCCLCFIDLDRFKAINDLCGHQAGDLLLQQVVAEIRKCIRDTDEFGRMGGDEFAILFFGCPITKAQQIAESICTAVANYRFDWEDRQFSVGASVGVVPIIYGDQPELVIEEADKACYQAKSAGRGRVCVDMREHHH
jgi:diguanylate cyclase (GGDEF)-like protein/PAS domain S-box-containing protein